MRFVARLNSEVLPNEEPFGEVSTTSAGEAIEGSDVVRGLASALHPSLMLTAYSSSSTDRHAASSTPASDSSMTRSTV